MQHRLFPRTLALVTLALVTAGQSACTCHTEIAPQKSAAKAAAPAKAEPAKLAPAQPEPAADPGKVELAAPTVSPSDAKAEAAKADAAANDPLGQRFVDPSWFRKEMLAGAKAMDVSRSERNEQGLFSSQILFELPAGTTAEQCAEQIEAKVKADVPNLVRAPDDKVPGRLKLTGNTQRYRVTMMCGEAKGVMRAYVSYEWTE